MRISRLLRLENTCAEGPWLEYENCSQHRHWHEENTGSTWDPSQTQRLPLLPAPPLTGSQQDTLSARIETGKNVLRESRTGVLLIEEE